MSERLWDRADEWTGFAPCADNPDFIIAPEDLGRLRTACVKLHCAMCPVRPECIVLNTAPVASIDLKKKDDTFVTRPSSSMWVAGVWMPDPSSAGLERELEAKREALIESLPNEHANRPGGVV